MNSVKLFGRLTKEPTIRTKEQDGKTSVTAYVTLAVQRPWKNSVGEYEADFPNIVFYKSGILSKNIYIREIGVLSKGGSGRS